MIIDDNINNKCSKSYMEVVIYCVSKKRLFLLGLFLFFVMFISGIYSISEELNDTTSGLSTGAVDIEIVEYNQDNQPFDQDGTMVMPGDEIILIPRVNNLGIDCYLRAKIEYTINNEVFSVTDYIEGDYSSWTKNGDYYYYGSVFPKRGSVDLFNKLNIPNLSSAYNGKLVIVHIVVEAIQAKNFDGNWDDVTIKESIDRAYDINYDGESSVIYEDNTNHHITLDNGFFDRLGNMLPGDKVSETINLLNSSNLTCEYYLSIDYDNLTTQELALLGKMKLLIKKQNGDILVDSNLADQNKHGLGIFESGEGDNYTIEVSLPSNIDNDFSRLFAKITWRFSYDILEDHYEPVPITGDNIDVSITVFLTSALGFLVVLFIWKRETENIEKNDFKRGD